MRTKIVLSSVALVGVAVLVGQMHAIAGADGVSNERALPEAGIDATTETAGEGTVAGTNVDIATSNIGNSFVGFSDYNYYGTAGSKRMFAGSTTSCNVGDSTAEWISGSSARHPLIAQNLYKYENGRFEQVGMNWVKHSFCAVSEPTCGSCQATGCSTLGLGCADTYWADLNGDFQDLGPRSEIDPQGFNDGGASPPGTHVHPYSTPPSPHRGRLAVEGADLGVAGAQYAFEGHYVTHDELPAQRHNNASWRKVNTTATSFTNIAGGTGTVRFQEAAIQAWQEWDPNVTIVNVTEPNAGRFHVGYNVTQLEGGLWHYEFAVHNMNSDRAAGGFSIPVGDNVTVSNIDFHDVDYLSEPYSDVDWDGVHENGAVTWTTESFADNANANALRWSTLYNFRFDADAPPVEAFGEIALFKPGSPDSLVFATEGPDDIPLPCVEDCGNPPDGAVTTVDLLALLAQWGGPGSCDFDGSGVATPDLLQLLAAWGACN